MKFEQTRVTLEPRSAGNCLDLALTFCGRHLGTVIGLWALFAVPLGLATYFAARSTLWGFWAAVLCGIFGSAPFGAMLAAGAARAAFGEDFTLRKSLGDLWTDGPLILKITALRMPLMLGFLMCWLPGLLLAVWWGFVVESQVLTKLHEKRHDRRTNELVRLEFSDLFVRGGMIALFGGMCWIILELTVDAAWTILFSQSLFFGRLGEMGSLIGDELDLELYFDNLTRLAFADPAVLTLHLVTGLAAYGICRLAWFFCYVDLRVRRDCWDLELELLDEAQRLGTTAT